MHAPLTALAAGAAAAATTSADIATGDTMRVRALVRPPAPPAYPGAWDLQRDALFSGLGGSGYALGPVERARRGDAGAAAAPGAAAARGDRARVSPRSCRGRRGGLRHPADRRAPRHSRRPTTRRSATRAWRTCWPSPGCISASSWAWVLAFCAAGARGVGARQPALADQEARRAGRAGCRRLLHGADRHACADRAQLRHGVPVTPSRCSPAGGRFRCAAWRWPRRC